MTSEFQNIQEFQSANCAYFFDEQFSITNFSALVEKAEKHSESLLDSATFAVRKAIKKDKSSPGYTVVMDDETKVALENNSVQLVSNNSGKLFAQLRDKKGRFSKKLEIQKELSDEGITGEALKMALDFEAIKTQLNIIIDSIRELEENVEDVIIGQKNDRTGLFYSGLSLYMESKCINDTFLKKQLVAQSLKSLSDANSQIIQDMRTSVDYLISEQYKTSKRATLKVREHLAAIRQCYGIVYRAYFLKASIYQENYELSAMLTVIDEYGSFIKNMIIPYIGFLNELDSDSKFIEKSTWGIIAKSLSGSRELIRQIHNNNIYYLNLGGKENVG